MADRLRMGIRERGIMRFLLIRSMVLLFWLTLPISAHATADMIMGVDSTTGVPEAISGNDAAAIIGTGESGLGPNFNATNGNIITGADESKKVTIYGSSGQNTSGVVLYRHSSGKTVIRCVESSVEGNCDVAVELASGKIWKVVNNSSTVIFKIDESTGKVSTMTVDGEDAGISITLYQKLCGGDLVGVDPASGTAGHIWNKSPLDTAPTAVAVTGTNRTTGYARFPDSDGNYGVQLTCYLPVGWTGQLDGLLWWKTGGTGNARLQIATKCYADNEADDAAFNTASVYTIAAGTSERPQRDVVSNITVTGCAESELLRIRLFRNRTEASDSLTGGTVDIEKFELWMRKIY